MLTRKHSLLQSVASHQISDFYMLFLSSLLLLEHGSQLAGASYECGSGWIEEYACADPIIGDYDLNKVECIIACLNHLECNCVTWLKDQPNTPCRLEGAHWASYRGDGAPYEAYWDLEDCDFLNVSIWTTDMDTAESDGNTSWIGNNYWIVILVFVGALFCMVILHQWRWKQLRAKQSKIEMVMAETGDGQEGALTQLKDIK